MLVICEDCAKRYNIDEQQIKGPKAQFSCKRCGHVIIVEKPSVTTPEPKQEELASEQSAPETIPQNPPEPEGKVRSRKKGRGLSIRSYLFITMIVGFTLISGAFAYLYLKYIPEIINNQIELRTSAITETFRGVITKPLLLRNYLQVNKEAQRTSKLPGVAYATVINKRGIVVAGFFSDLRRFDRTFEAQVKKQGFPVSILAENKLGSGDGHGRIMVGGQSIFDTVSAIPDSGGEVHVGIYVSDVDTAIRNALVSPTTISVMTAILISGILVLFFLTRMITKPMQELTDIANRISLGELDLVVEPGGPREMRALAVAFERMRISIKAAVERLA
jgi:HAMP domain-containing protein/DNA-directed RNA polymerase subunit RPC12/RpoP